MRRRAAAAAAAAAGHRRIEPPRPSSAAKVGTEAAFFEDGVARAKFMTNVTRDFEAPAHPTSCQVPVQDDLVIVPVQGSPERTFRGPMVWTVSCSDAGAPSDVLTVGRRGVAREVDGVAAPGLLLGVIDHDAGYISPHKVSGSDLTTKVSKLYNRERSYTPASRTLMARQYRSLWRHGARRAVGGAHVLEGGVGRDRLRGPHVWRRHGVRLERGRAARPAKRGGSRRSRRECEGSIRKTV